MWALTIGCLLVCQQVTQQQIGGAPPPWRPPARAPNTVERRPESSVSGEQAADCAQTRASPQDLDSQVAAYRQAYGQGLREAMSFFFLGFALLILVAVAVLFATIYTGGEIKPAKPFDPEFERKRPREERGETEIR